MFKFRALVLAGLLSFGVSHHSNAIAPVIAIGITAGSTSTSLASASTAIVGLTLTAFAIAKSIAFPTEIKFPKKLYDTASGPDGSPIQYSDNTTELTGTCQWQMRQENVQFHNDTVWANLVQSSCSNPAYQTSVRDQQATSASNCPGQPTCFAVWIKHYRARCLSTNCGLIVNNETASWSGAQAFSDQVRAQEVATANQSLQMTYDRATNFYKYPAGDADLPASVGGDSGLPVITNNGMALGYTNGANKASVATFSATSLGQSIDNYTQTDASTISRTSMQVDNSGVVQSVAQTTLSGAINPVPVSDPLTVVNYSPVGSTSSNPGTNPSTGSQTTVQFPSDYARAGEAASAAQIVSENLLSGEVVTPVVADSEMPWFGDTFDPVSGFQINTVGASCPVWQFNALDENFYIDHHCTLITNFNGLFYAMFTALWALLAFRTVMEA